jgi:cation diffusion facilitator family transporter
MADADPRRRVLRYAWFSIGAALLTIGLKVAAYLVTDSVGMLSDALESLVNLAAALVALVALSVAARPPDEEHAYGHTKAEYFAVGIEGGLVLIAAYSIADAALHRLFAPQAIEQPGLGLAISAVAATINGAVALTLRRAATQLRSVTLAADAHHLLTDVWTTLGVIAGVALVALSGISWLDPLIALLVALQIVRTGIELVRGAALGLMDTAVTTAERERIAGTLQRYTEEHPVAFHALRTRQSGARAFVSLHVLVPDDWTVRAAHTLAEQLEHDLRQAVPGAVVFTHLEPRDDPRSFADEALQR